jgi:hypothetical protein
VVNLAKDRWRELGRPVPEAPLDVDVVDPPHFDVLGDLANLRAALILTLENANVD